MINANLKETTLKKKKKTLPTSRVDLHNFHLKWLILCLVKAIPQVSPVYYLGIYAIAADFADSSP